jgi:hypothetical protein
MTRLRAITLGALALAAASCADNGDEVLLIIHNQVPDEGCIISGDATGVFKDDGILDVVGGTGYLFTPVIKNTAIADTTNEATRTAFVTGARVDLRFADPTIFSEQELSDLSKNGVTRFETPLGGGISPNGGTAPFSFDIVPSSLSTVLGDKLGTDTRKRILILADVTMRAKLGGSTIESQTFTFPVAACAGCLVVNIGACAALPTEFDAVIGNECNPFQDGSTQCCQQADGGLICPAVGTRTGG